MKLKPIGERVILKPLKAEEKTKSGIYLPKSEEKKQGEVVAVGTFKFGKPLPLKEGDKILYGGYSSEEFEINGEKYLIIEFKDVLAKLEDSQDSNIRKDQELETQDEFLKSRVKDSERIFKLDG